MAKGNEGNLLQHGVEVELGCALAELADASPLTIVFTHAMAPSEECKQTAKSGTKLIKRWLSWPYSTAQRPRVSEAYRRCHASWRKYPNSGELLAAMLGREHLRGHLFDVDEEKVRLLQQVWAESKVVAHHLSWREGLPLVVADELPGPWLISMDPYTFTPGDHSASEGDLDPADLQLVELVAENFFTQDVPGALLVFCYKLGPGSQEAFKAAMRAQFEGRYPGVGLTFIETGPIGLDRHVGVVVTNEARLGALAAKTWERLQVEGGR